ncbi:gelsolin isoform X1 [Helicoverpa armigera]|uniref:gelsolin isoform X1 n=1 Tax=Helicoverpa armigera TaxID=29058 RepID=UPI00211129CD|nr:gelsolin isoform X1 [Helicoverpa armigera]XP_049695860.1 gelsolin isoform X2 [Helicoverpa armigera]XP_049695861.1 gelsolin isoform X3 [Helicoverpa armigera]
MPEVHPAFANSGKKAGLEVWRIEDFEPVPVPASHHGNFYSGDSYIVLSTTGDASRLSWDIHFWLGSKSTQDERGSAAVLTVNLDDEQFHGAAVQHREVQGYESKLFLDYFQPAIRYLDGGHASGFNHVTINEGAEKRLFQIKGKRNVRVRQVDVSFASLNKGDCFVLDVNHEIYLYVGDNAKSVERLKAITVANQIRDQDHNGRASIEIIDADSRDSDFEKFFEALGSGDKDSVAEATEGGDDEQEFEKGASTEVSLSEISDSSGSIKITKLEPPLTKDLLNTKECYILDTGSYSGIYVWVGRESNDKEKSEAMKKAEQYLKWHNYPEWVPVTRIPEGVEPTAFKQNFQEWQ